MSHEWARHATHLCEKCGRTSIDSLTHSRDLDEYWCDFCLDQRVPPEAPDPDWDLWLKPAKDLYEPKSRRWVNLLVILVGLLAFTYCQYRIYSIEMDFQSTIKAIHE